MADSPYEVDKEIYMKWFEEKTLAIEQMDKDTIQARIIELAKMEFFIKREWSMLHQHYDKITGRKGIPPHLKAERDKLITDPNIQVAWEEPRPKIKKEKKEKRDLKSLLGIDIEDLKAELKKGGKESKEKVEEKVEKKGNLDEALSILTSPPAPPKEKTPEEKARLEALKAKFKKKVV